jgi:hypothetical protein
VDEFDFGSFEKPHLKESPQQRGGRLAGLSAF